MIKDTGDNSQALTTKIREIARESPELGDLTADQIDKLANMVIIEELKEKLKTRIQAERISWDKETELFIQNISRIRSRHTERNYRQGLRALDEFCEFENIESRILLTPREADNFIFYLRTLGKHENTQRLYIAACSSFYTFLERRYKEIKNPFRGSKARPAGIWATATIPADKEIKAIKRRAAGDHLLVSAITIVLDSGLRIGSLPHLRIKESGEYTTTTKGKAVNGILSKETLRTIENHGLLLSRPFDPERHIERATRRTAKVRTPKPEKIAELLKGRLARIMKELKDAGRIAAVYSFHDLRHYCAKVWYESGGIHYCKERLGHSSLTVTERYLRNVLGIDTGAKS